MLDVSGARMRAERMYFHTPSRCDDRLVTTSPSYCPTEDDVVKDDILYLCCLMDSDVELAVLDVDIRCLECVPGTP